MLVIRDWLHIGGFNATKDTALLKVFGITSMLQLHQPSPQEGIETLFLHIEDGRPILPHEIETAVGFLKAQHAQGKKILVACGSGISRSVTFSVIALKEIEGLSLHDAYQAIRTRHPEALPDHSHWDALRAYYGEGEDFWTLWKENVMKDDNAL